MRRPSRFSESVEDYLEAIIMLGGKNVRSIDIANHLQVSRASVSRALGLLADKGLIDKKPYGDISLTSFGIETSRRVEKKHLIVKSFLIDVLGVDKERANIEACGIEHNISEDTAERIQELVQRIKK